MSTLILDTQRDCVNALGIPVDTLTLNTAVDRIIAMAHRRDGRARLVSTLNVVFLVSSLGTALTRPRHPELLEVLRTSDLVTADGFPIVWLSRLLGRPLPGRVCGSDMVPALAERAARDGLSIFLLGGAPGVGAEAGRVLERAYPGLRIAGAAAPMIRTAGPQLAETPQDDSELLQEIHESGADILLVGLGNPKQELWFNRNRAALRVPVSIGVGGSFEFITGKTRRAPEFWQRLNLEWLFRLTQDPARLWRRYGKGAIKLTALAAPVVAERLRESLTPCRTSAAELNWRRLWSSRDDSISVLRLPRVIDATFLQYLNRELQCLDGESGLRILDFSATRRVLLSAQQELFNLAALAQRGAGQLQLMGISSRLRRQLASARLLDLLEASRKSGDPLEQLTSGAAVASELSCRSYTLGDAVFLMLAGRVSRSGLEQMGFVECAMHNARDRRCVIDLRNVSMLESSGIAALLPLLQGQNTSGHVMIAGAGHGARQMLRMAEVEGSVRYLDDRRLLDMIAGGQSDD